VAIVSRNDHISISTEAFLTSFAPFEREERGLSNGANGQDRNMIDSCKNRPLEIHYFLKTFVLPTNL